MSDVWGWFGTPTAGISMEFEAPATQWLEWDWLAPLGLMMAAEAGAPETETILLLIGDLRSNMGVGNFQ